MMYWGHPGGGIDGHDRMNYTMQSSVDGEPLTYVTSIVLVLVLPLLLNGVTCQVVPHGTL